jgi:hypothetical protein
MINQIINKLEKTNSLIVRPFPHFFINFNIIQQVLCQIRNIVEIL